MKILFLSTGGFPDYQHDIVFHGGRSLFGEDFVDYQKVWHQYKDDKETYWSKEIPYWNQVMPTSTQRAMSLYGLFESDNIDRTDIERKIANKYFDFIIIGSVHRALSKSSENIRKELQMVSKVYPPEKLILIDGEDDQLNIVVPLLNKGFYFKRELTTKLNAWSGNRMYPIHFAIPKEKITHTLPEKTRVMAHIIPGNQSTYIYETEEQYYGGYQESYFGVTFKKGGWDCMRHYEILANRSIPYFPGLHECPLETMHRFPKDILLQYNKDFEEFGFDPEDSSDVDKYLEIEHSLYEHTKQYLTTESVMKYIIDTVQQNQS